MDAKPRRRWFQFRLRTIFWLTLLAAICCAMGPPLWRWAEPRLYPNPSVRYLGEVVDYRTAQKIKTDRQFRANYLAARRLRLRNGQTPAGARPQTDP